MTTKLQKNEALLAAVCCALIATAALAPSIRQSIPIDDFADQRTLWGVPFAMDVLSNLAFAFVGLAGLALVWRGAGRAALGNMERAMAILLFAGMCVLAIGSAAYHLAPGARGLAADRACMVLPVAGLLGLAAAAHVSARAGALLGLAAVALGLLAARLWVATGNVLPWGVFQAGAVVLLAWMGSQRALPGALQVRWLAVLGAYGVAKAFELGDHAVFAASGCWLSGHTLKHLSAAAAAWPVLHALRGAAWSRQNAAGIAFSHSLAARR